jgi:hypothetical protein
MPGTSLLLDTDTRITCPQCRNQFSLEQGFAEQALETVESTSQSALSRLREEARVAADKRADELAAERARTFQHEIGMLRGHLKQQQDENQTRLDAMAAREAELAMRERAIEVRVQEVASQRAADLVAGERAEFAKRLQESQQRVASLQAEQLQLREERQKLKDEKEALALEVRRQVDSQLVQREAMVRAQEQERYALDKAEQQKKLDDMTAQLAEVQRKAEQGSQQMQGEVLELALEEGLRRAFPLDRIDEVKKGVRGGDVIHHVQSRSGAAAGVLLWETKRASAWSPQWLAKLKEDMRGCAADVGVLVTMPTATPKEWTPGTQFGLVDDIWVATWQVALQLAEVLRSSLLDVHKQRLASAGKGEKMEAVYDYVTSPQFAQKLKGVMEAFQRMREELESEKNQTLQRWARREKQLEAGKMALLGVGGDIQGLAQQDLPQLELDPDTPTASR